MSQAGKHTHNDDMPPNIPDWTMGDRLRKARRHANLQAIELAERIGVSANTIGNAENDRGVTRRTLVGWSWATGVPIEWLEHGTVEETVPAGRAERRAVAAPTHAKKAASEGRRRRAVNRRQGQEPLTDPGTDFRWSSAPRPALVVLPSAS